MGILNKAQVDALFQREAVLFGSQDGVPISGLRHCLERAR